MVKATIRSARICQPGLRSGWQFGVVLPRKDTGGQLVSAPTRQAPSGAGFSSQPAHTGSHPYGVGTRSYVERTFGIDAPQGKEGLPLVFVS